MARALAQGQKRRHDPGGIVHGHAKVLSVVYMIVAPERETGEQA
jgi:hypothetical protein